MAFSMLACGYVSTMPIGYLITATLVGLALAQPRRPSLLGKMSWLSAPVFNELPFVVGLPLAAGAASAEVRNHGGSKRAASSLEDVR